MFWLGKFAQADTFGMKFANFDEIYLFTFLFHFKKSFENFMKVSYPRITDFMPKMSAGAFGCNN